jgi:hypothetical protein
MPRLVLLKACSSSPASWGIISPPCGAMQANTIPIFPLLMQTSTDYFQLVNYDLRTTVFIESARIAKSELEQFLIQIWWGSMRFEFFVVYILPLRSDKGAKELT